MVKIKKVFVLIIIILFSMNCFAAIVSDNDGIAFTSKGEFDALKNNFANQIAEYNKSIDNKLDGAIASYLSGISISDVPINLYEKIKKLYGTPFWIQGNVPVGLSTVTPEISIDSTVHLTADEFSKLKYAIHTMGNGKDGWSYNSEVYIYNGDSFTWTTGGAGRTNSIGQSGMTSVAGGASAHDIRNTTNADCGNWGYYAGASATEHALKNYQKNDRKSISIGSGEGWLSQTQGAITFLKYFSISMYPRHEINSWYHVYKNWSGAKGSGADYSQYLKENGRKIDTVHTTVDIDEIAGKTTVYGTKYGDGSTSSGDYYEIHHSVSKTLDGVDYFKCMFSDATNPNIYYVDEGYDGELASSYTTFDVDDTTFTAIYYRKLGGTIQTNDYKGGKFNLKMNEFNMKNSKLNEFDSFIASNIAGSPVKNVGGCPIVDIIADNQDITLKFKILSSDVSDTATVEFSREPFDLGVAKPEDSYKKLTAVKCDDGENTITISGAEKGKIYIFIKNETSLNSLQITDLVIA